MSIYRTKETIGVFKKDMFVIGTNDTSEYFPIYIVDSQRNGYDKIKLYDELNEDIILYYKPEKRYDTISSDYSLLFNHLNEQIGLTSLQFAIKGEKFCIHCSRGYISDDKNNILLLLCINDLNIIYEDIIDPNKLLLYVSIDFLTNPKYKNIYKRVYSDYIENLLNHNITITYTTSNKIEKKVFNNKFKIEFETISELDKYLKSDEINKIYSN